MTDADRQQQRSWPQTLQQDDDLYAVENTDTGEIEYLIFSSIEKRSTFIRDNGAWWKVGSSLIDDLDDPKYSLEFVSIDFIDQFDQMQNSVVVNKVRQMPKQSAEPVTAAAPASCPPATSNIELNLKNRERAISVAEYGPLNPKEENRPFWQKKADNWSVSIDDAKKSLCGNCVFFVTTTEIKNCIADGIKQGGSGSENAWDAIDTAELGFCEAFDFKCAASRTCDAWVVGGPITDASVKPESGI